MLLHTLESLHLYLVDICTSSPHSAALRIPQFLVLNPVGPPCTFPRGQLLNKRIGLLTEWRVDEHSVVELCGRGGDVDGLHLLEGAERVALGHQLGDGPLVQRPSDQQDYVVDHVAGGFKITR